MPAGEEQKEPQEGNGRLVDRSHVREKECTNMPLINIVFTLIVVGVALWLINRFIPMASSIKTILNVVVVLAVCVWLFQAAGLWRQISSYRITQ
jgi:predicted membrane protein